MPITKSTGYRPGIPQQPYTKWDTEKDEVEVDYKQMSDGKGNNWFSGSKGVVLKILLIIVIFSLGLIIGYVIRRSVHEVLMPQQKCPYLDRQEGYSKELTDRMKKDILPESLEDRLKRYTQFIHLSGTNFNTKLGDMLIQEFRNYHLTVKESKYNALLSFQHYEMPNAVSLISDNGTVIRRMTYEGKHPDYHPEYEAFSAYAPNGTVQGELVYANYGQEKDFKLLEESNIKCENNIVIMRIGKLYRGDKVMNAAKCGAAGVLLYADPAEVTGFHSDAEEDVYPYTWETPDWAIMRGAVIPELLGDPRTPGLPSIEGMYRLPLSETHLPRIPVQPISYGQAEELMKYMTGPTSEGFHGSLHRNVTYAMGPGYAAPREGFKVELEVNNELENEDIRDIFGIIEGQEEPDRYIVIGCHYDAWTFGATDPNSGTAILMELAKAFGNMTQRGWRPRRTLIFAHWDAEEQAIIGSYEWVEEHLQELDERLVAYVNLDMAVEGNYTLSVAASPLMRDIIYHSAEDVDPAVPTNDTTSLFSQWLTRSTLDNAGMPSINNIVSGTDHAPFVFLLGAPALWPRYTFSKDEHSVAGIPNYHNMMDRFAFVKQFVDPEFRAHKSLADLVGEIIMKLSNAAKLPMDAREYAQTLYQEYDVLHSDITSDLFPLNTLEKAIKDFNGSAVKFMEQFQQANIKDVLQVRRLNDRIMKLSRSFITGEGLPSHPMYKNVLFGDKSRFPGIVDAYNNYKKATSPADKILLKQTVQKQISIATLAVQSASRILSDITNT